MTTISRYWYLGMYLYMYLVPRYLPTHLLYESGGNSIPRLNKRTCLKVISGITYT